MSVKNCAVQHAKSVHPRNTLFCWALAATLVSMGWGRSGLSDDTDPSNLKKLSLEELSQIEVTTPSRQPTKILQTPAAIYVITGEDIRRAGATSIPEALRLAPGVEVAKLDSNKWSVGIRGFGSRLTRSVLVLIDGRTVFTPLFDGTYWEVQDTVLEDVERIEVIRGPGATIWGPNAVNGVINIITKETKDTHGTLVSAGGGNEEQGFLSMRHGGGNGKTLNYRVYGKTFNRGPESHQDGHNFDDWRAVQGGFRVDWAKNSRDSFTFQGDIYDERAGESVAAATYSLPYVPIVEGNALLSGGNVMGRWSRANGDGNDIQIQAYYDRTRRMEANFGETRNTFDVDYLQRRKWRWNQFSWGLGTRVDPVENREVVNGLTFTPAKRTDYLMTAFLQDEIQLVPDRLALTIGTKLLRTNFTSSGLQPSVRLMWTPTDKQTLWAAYTHALRTPSDSEEDFNLSGIATNLADGTPIYARFIANDHFAPEQLNGYELGYRRLIGKTVYVDATGFYNHYHDLFSEDITGGIFLESTPAPAHLLLPAQFRNGLQGNTKGVEIAPEWRPSDIWRLRGSYSHLHMNIDKAPNSGDVGSGPGIVGSSPQHQVAIQSSLDVTRKWQVDLNHRYVSGLTGQSVDRHPEVWVHAYSTLDARLGWRVNEQFEISFVGRNLLQPSHHEFGSDPGPLVGIQRSAFVRLTWSK